MIRAPLVEASERPAPGTFSPGAATATWYVQRGANDTAWRCDFPAEAIGGRVSYIEESNLDRGVTTPNRDTGIPWGFRVRDRLIQTKTGYRELCRSRVTLDLDALEIEFPSHEGAAVWTRPCGRRAMLAMAMREQGILTVAETDDNYFAAKHWNLHQRQVDWGDAEMDVVARAMCAMDRNVFSTEWLRDRYYAEYKKRLGKQYLPDLFVARNCVPRSAWPDRADYDGPIRVGFMGSGSHVWDVQQSFKAIHAAKTYWGATTTFIGYSPGSPDQEPDEIEVDGETIQLRSEKSKRFRDGWARVIDTHIPWIDPGAYRRAALPLDIGLAPIARADDFTMGKSDAKALEYTISGAACVLWNTGIYNSAGWKHEENCLLVGSSDEMALAVKQLIDDPKLRYELVTAAQEMVWETRNEDTLRREWEEALDL